MDPGIGSDHSLTSTRGRASQAAGEELLEQLGLTSEVGNDVI